MVGSIARLLLKSEQATAGQWVLEIPSPNLADSALAVSFSFWFPPPQRFGLWYYTDVSPDSVHGQCALSAITARVSILPVLI